MNPIFDRKYFVPDPEAHTMPDGKLYVYGSLDISGNNDYCSPYQRVFSTDDLTSGRWTDHGVAYSNTEENPQIYWRKTSRLSAPDAIHKDGKYYMYVCSSVSQIEGMATSDSPCGPFRDTCPVAGADGDGIDPSVFVDDDGSAYLFWGQFHLRGGKLNADMCSLEESTVNRYILTEQQHGFHEGASIRKRGSKYYMVYADISRGSATCLSYAMADSPLGPYKKKGVIIDNMYCDPHTWNNHGSIEEFKGQWYVFYHRSTQNSRYSRRACVEKIYFNEDGTINETEMTSQGASGPINAFGVIDASVACRLKGNGYIKPDAEGINGEILTNCGGGSWSQDWAEYKYINFGEGIGAAVIKARGSGTISLYLGDGNTVGTVRIDGEVWREYALPVTRTQGVHPLWILFDGKGIDLAYFRFLKSV